MTLIDLEEFELYFLLRCVLVARRTKLRGEYFKEQFDSMVFRIRAKIPYGLIDQVT